MTRHGIPLDGSVFSVRYQGAPLRRRGVDFIERGRFTCRFLGYARGSGWMRFEFAPTALRFRGAGPVGITYRDVWSFMRDWTVLSGGPGC